MASHDDPQTSFFLTLVSSVIPEIYDPLFILTRIPAIHETSRIPRGKWDPPSGRWAYRISSGVYTCKSIVNDLRH